MISDLVLVLLKKASKKRGKKSCSKKKIVVLWKLEKKEGRSDSWYAKVLNFHIKLYNQFAIFLWCNFCQEIPCEPSIPSIILVCIKSEISFCACVASITSLISCDQHQALDLQFGLLFNFTTARIQIALCVSPLPNST